MVGRKAADRHDYDGSCKPGGAMIFAQETFSVSVFKWVKKASGGLKKAKSVYRIYGSVHDPESVYRRAEEVCDHLDNGGTMDKKSERVRS